MTEKPLKRTTIVQSIIQDMYICDQELLSLSEQKYRLGNQHGYVCEPMSGTFGGLSRMHLLNVSGESRTDEVGWALVSGRGSRPSVPGMVDSLSLRYDHVLEKGC